MTRRRLSEFIDALAEGRRPGRFRAEPEDVNALRTAITLRAARPGDAVPDEQFVSDLFESLSAPASSEVVPITRATKRRRGRVAVAAVAAGLVLVGGTAAVTESLQPAAVPAAVSAPQGAALRTGTFETADGQIMGQIVAYRGNPSWVFMNVDGSSYTGPIVCQLQVANGTTVAVGDFQLQGGTGQFSRNVQVDIGRLRGAKLVNASGTIVASATFA
ncbi:MAG TPA: hypothetical protein VG205_00690 [Acidimicrobiales bacterium]|nr:hypothetical protein [Acidimicrobiales bacterium]